MEQNFQTQSRTAPTINSNSIILRSILAKTVKIEKILKNNNIVQIKTQRIEKKDKKRLKDIIKQEEKQKKKQKLNLGKKLKDTRSKTGILDSISNFMTFTFFGWLFSQTEKYLPKLLGIVNLLKGASDGIGWVTRFFLDALTTFIGAGYKVYDNIKNTTEQIKKLPVKENFDKVGKALYDNFDILTGFFDDIANITKDVKTSNTSTTTKSSSKPILKGAVNGAFIGSTRGGIPTNLAPSRELKINKIPKKPQKQIIPEGKIGKDIGGEVKIREFYGSPKVGVGGIINIFKSKGIQSRKTPIDTISNISKTLKRGNSLFGDLASVGSEIAIGKKPDKNVYRNTAKDVVYIAQLIAQNQEDKLKNSLIGMAYGGVVPNKMHNIKNQANLVDLVEGVIKYSVEKRVNSALNSLRGSLSFIDRAKQKSRAGVSFAPDGTPYFDGSYGSSGSKGYGWHQSIFGDYMGDDSYFSEGAGITKVEMKGMSQNDIIALGKIIQAEASSESNLGKAGVLNVILNRYRAIKSNVAKPSDFKIFGKSARDVTLSDIILARSEDGTYQFSPVGDGSFARVNPEQGQRALQRALQAGGNDPQKFLENLKRNGMSQGDAEYTVRSVGFYNPLTSQSNPFGTRTVMLGRHGFQQSSFIQLKGPIGRINANLLGVGVAGVKGFRTGLKTGPEGRIGAGTGFHVDARFVTGLSLKDKILMLDSMALAHASEGFVMEFSGSNVAGLRWNPNASQKDKEKLAKKVLVSHWAPRAGYEPFDYYIVKRTAKDRSDISAEGSNIMAPLIPGGTFEYQQGRGQGRFLIIRDKKGNEIMRILHGDEGLPSPRELGKMFKMDELLKERINENIIGSNLSSGNNPLTFSSLENQNLGSLGTGRLFGEKILMTPTEGTPKDKIVNFANNLSERLKKTKKGEFIDIIHKGEKFSLKNMGNGEFFAYSKNKKIEAQDFFMDLNYAISNNLPYGNIKTNQNAAVSIDNTKNRRRIRDINQKAGNNVQTNIRGEGARIPKTKGVPQGRGITRTKNVRGEGARIPKAKGVPQGRGTGRSRIKRRKTGGIIGNYDSLSNYASYEGYGGVSLIAIQPMIIQQQVPIQQQIPVPIPFPVASGVNNIDYNRA